MFITMGNALVKAMAHKRIFGLAGSLCPLHRGGFRHVQHVRPNRGPTKRGTHKRNGKFLLWNIQ